MMFPKRVSRPPPRVLAEVVGGELGGLSEEGAELRRARRYRKNQLWYHNNLMLYEKDAWNATHK